MSLAQTLYMSSSAEHRRKCSSWTCCPRALAGGAKRGVQESPGAGLPLPPRAAWHVKSWLFVQ